MSKADPCIIVIFGALGDLTVHKLIPALFHLSRAEYKTNHFKVLGIDRNHLTDREFRERLRECAKVIKDFNDQEWHEFAARLHYKHGDLTETETYDRIAARLEQMSVAEDAGRNHLFYSATPPSLAPAIIDGLGMAGLAGEEKGWSRIIIEKPFGHDTDSARELNNTIARVFDEHQIYRIDHYLGKEAVQNIMAFRFGNSLFEPFWNRNYVDYVEITTAEAEGAGHRAGFYEETGALRDVVVNHLLQLLALITMERPAAFDANSMRDEKVKVWQAIHPMTIDEVAERTVRGQYVAGEVGGESVPAYRDEEGVAKNSSTETFAAVEFRVENQRWTGVPFYLRTGKRLARYMIEIAIHFNQTPHAKCANAHEDMSAPDVIVLSIQPDKGINAIFEANQHSDEMRVSSLHRSAFGERLYSAYEVLILNAMRGDATLFEGCAGIEAQWILITPILTAWSKGLPELQNYSAGSDGPEAVDRLVARNGHSWRPIGNNTK